MLLNRTVTLKVVVTEDFKREMIKALEEALEQVDQARTQLDFRSRIYLAELQRTDLAQASEFRRRIEAEKQRHDSAKEQLNEQLEMIRNAQDGEELVRGEIEGFVDVQVGDRLSAKLNNAEIVVKDGVVVEIREPQP